MPLVRFTQREEIPGEAGEWMEFRQLSWKRIDQARDARQDSVLGKFRRMGGEVVAALQQAEADKAGADELAAAAGDPLNDYDLATLLYEGIAAWSYPDKLRSANIDDLAPETARWAANMILMISLPADEAARLKG